VNPTSAPKHIGLPALGRLPDASKRQEEAIELIRSHGFVYVPADQLDSPYDGINSPNNPNDGDARGTKPLMRTIPSRFEARLSDLVSKHKLSQHYDELRRDLRLGFSIHRHKGPLKTGASRFGGLPDVPRNFSWPRTAFGYLHFIAQLRFGELPAFNDDFPRRGYMLFFASMEGSTCRILWYPSVPRRLDPSVVPPHEEFSPFDAEMPIFAPQPVRFEPSMYIPPQDPSNCVDDELWWRRHQLQEDMEGPDSRLGGYAYYDPDRYGLAGGFRNWESVMQVDSFHPSSDMLWSDNGKLAFFVRRGCLKRHAFGHVSSVTLGAC